MKAEQTSRPAEPTPEPAAGDRARAGSGSWRRDPDFSRAVLDDLYRYRRKRPLLAWLLWGLTGLLGGHRLYLERTGTGLLMLFTGGGFLIWWLVDAFLLPGMVRRYNEEQEKRKRAGLPPIALEFMPPLRGGAVPIRPEWAEKRGGRARLFGDALVLLVSGVALGAVSADTGNFEGVLAILALIAIINLGTRWQELARLPLLRELDRWSHRLRLYYLTNDPGGPASLLFRPLVGPLSALFRKRARAEVRLYLQLGAAFAVVFTLFDVAEAVAITGSGVELSPQAFAEDLLLTFISIYAFATPIGATLTTHLILEKTDRVLWILSALAVAAVAMGLFGS